MTNQTITRRGAIVSLFIAILSTPRVLLAGVQLPKRQRVQWVKLKEEPVGVGDFWASYDPNTPERQAESGFNLQLQAVHPSYYGVPAKKIGIGNGSFWRPIGLIDC